MKQDQEQRTWQRVLVYGLGASGAAAAEFLRDRGIGVVGVDRRYAEDLELGALAAGAAGADVELVLGEEPSRLPPAIDAVVVSPGIPLDRPILKQARKRAIPVLAEVELAFPHLDGRVVGITGSNGKSTTTAMTGALLEASGIAAEVCGNIGVPLVSVVDGAPDRVFVVELSSFQLETVSRFRPKAAALLNVSPDHLDRHGTLESYLAVKANLFARQQENDFAVLNADDPLVRRVGTHARKRYFSRHEKVEDGCYLDGDLVVEVDPETGARELFRSSDVGQLGAHNLENAMAAALLARSMGAAPGGFSAALARFEGLPHRMETVALIDGVHWIDDSKGTNVAAVLKSLEAMPEGTVHLILGGRGKGESFGPLRQPVSEKAARAYLIGETAAELRTELEGSTPLEDAGDLESAVRRAAEEAVRGETVLLSPACTSFDQYSNFAARGDHFHQLVCALVSARSAEGDPADEDPIGGGSNG
ncbi:MAG: UDP-N-acetylmuramoyl-L-alanine--D-glutamate ligase [bacterium]|nr:UDP-N-acetylmuramoyl-L-alanine--D-glutamate ligase [bacterium]